MGVWMFKEGNKRSTCKHQYKEQLYHDDFCFCEYQTNYETCETC